MESLFDKEGARWISNKRCWSFSCRESEGVPQVFFLESPKSGGQGVEDTDSEDATSGTEATEHRDNQRLPHIMKETP
jgi:hypothetical protein